MRSSATISVTTLGLAAVLIAGPVAIGQAADPFAVVSSAYKDGDVWPAKFAGGRDVAALTAQVDIFPTLAEIVGATLSDEVKQQVEGRSLLPLLTKADAPWPDRTLVTHVGRWPHGKMEEFKYRGCSIRDARFTLVNNTELYDLQADPGEKTNVLDAHPEVVTKLRAAYEQWWKDVQPLQVNENAVGPKVNPFKELYWKQFGGGPDAALRKFMDPATTNFGEGGRGKNPPKD